MSLTPQPAFTPTPPSARTPQNEGAIDTPTPATGEAPFVPVAPTE